MILLSLHTLSELCIFVYICIFILPKPMLIAKERRKENMQRHCL